MAPTSSSLVALSPIVFAIFVFCLYAASGVRSTQLREQMRDNCVAKALEYMESLKPVHTALEERRAKEMTEMGCAAPSDECLWLFENVVVTMERLFNATLVEKLCAEGSFQAHFQLGLMFEKARSVRTTFRRNYTVCFNQIAHKQICETDLLVTWL
ncbi:hypothetical protein QR680_012472 [Steinernema hermaphroditum]|uniref:Uncharacterized protein n=1 Tax=Steinernema hermaphroditum TaxID=289476 RepID=A0AA39M0T4_9BILA|nr:hypothetical protein QR680_012472 [Steinernema hermaphroditum]